MNTLIKLQEKYEYHGWPAIARPDLKPPEGWHLSLLTAVNLLGGHELSPDGQSVAFTWMRDEQTDVYTMPAAGGWPRRISTERKLAWPGETVKWSPDSQWLTFAMNGHVYVAPAAGGLPKKISDFATAAASPIWLPDNHGLVVTVERQDSEQLLLTDRDGQWPRPLVTRTDGDCGEARPSPDGRLISYTFRPFADLNRLDIHVVELATGQIRELTPWPKVRNWHGRWSPDGAQIAFISQQSGWNEVWLVQPDDQGLRQLSHLELDGADIAWSPDGTRLACTLNQQGALHLALLDAQTGQATTLRADEGVYTQPQWSPEGQKVLVLFESPLQPPDLRFVDLDGRITPSPSPCLAR